MLRDHKNFQDDRITRLEHQLSDLTAALTEQKEQLERHAVAMEKLAGALRHIDLTIKREVRRGSHQSFLRLDELIRLFVEYEINPRYYRALNTVAVKGITDSRHTELTTQKQNFKAKKKSS